LGAQSTLPLLSLAMCSALCLDGCLKLSLLLCLTVNLAQQLIDLAEEVVER
jgi:hypothetical protein